MKKIKKALFEQWLINHPIITWQKKKKKKIWNEIQVFILTNGNTNQN
jgi:hypothetical protein